MLNIFPQAINRSTVQVSFVLRVNEQEKRLSASTFQWALFHGENKAPLFSGEL